MQSAQSQVLNYCLPHLKLLNPTPRPDFLTKGGEQLTGPCSFLDPKDTDGLQNSSIFWFAKDNKHLIIKHINISEVK